MSGVVWSRFFWSDWANDPALRVCSFAAQGMWMHMLCIAAKHDPIGIVAVAGRGLDVSELARAVGGNEIEVQSLLSELDRNGVFSRDRHGRIYSRRMMRDHNKSKAASKNGKMGGNPSLCKNKGNPASDNHPLNQEDKPQELIAKNQERKRKEDTASAVSSAATYAFESGVIRLKQVDFDKWKEAFSYLDLRAELIGVTQWAEMQGPAKWFFAVSGALAKRNREAKQAVEKAKSAPAFKWASGIEGVI